MPTAEQEATATHVEQKKAQADNTFIKRNIKEWLKKEGETLQELHVRRWKMACKHGLYTQKKRDKMKASIDRNENLEQKKIKKIKEIQETSPPLPEGWTISMNGDASRAIYYHPETQKRQWERPKTIAQLPTTIQVGTQKNNFTDEKLNCIKLRLVIEILKQKIEKEQQKYLEWVEKNTECEYEDRSLEWARGLDDTQLAIKAEELVKHRNDLISKRVVGYKSISRLTKEQLIELAIESRKNSRVLCRKNVRYVICLDKPFIERVCYAYTLAEQGNLTQHDMLSNTDRKYLAIVKKAENAWRKGLCNSVYGKPHWHLLISRRSTYQKYVTRGGQYLPRKWRSIQKVSINPGEQFQKQTISMLRVKEKKLQEELVSIKNILKCAENLYLVN